MGFHHIPKPPRIIAPGGPVSAALRTMREAAEPAPLLSAEFDRDRLELDAVRRTIRAQIEADLDRIDRCLGILDSLDGDPDLEDGADAEPSLCGITITDPSGTGHDEEGPDDNGVADDGGLAWVSGGTRSVEEFNRRLARGRL